MKTLNDIGFDRNQLEGLIWDMDGVLVDVSESYLEAVRLTASHFLQREVLPAEVQQVKRLVGMNNDWYATHSLVYGEKDFTRINRSSKEFKDIYFYFQALYLGESLFEECYGKAPEEKTPGLITRELPLISTQNLSKLKQVYGKMAIATGRPRLEATATVALNKWEPVFDEIITQDDTEREKPYPDPILEAQKRLGIEKTLYIGDSSSDVAAAEAAGVPIVFIGTEPLGDIQVANTKELLTILL